MAHIPYEFVTHTQRVQRLYKRVIRDIQAWNTRRYEFRIQAVLMRQKFEDNRHVKDPLKAKRILEEAEEKFDYIRCRDPLLFPYSKGGVAFKRNEQHPTDQVLDFWHPLEKAQYPDYFAKREKRKKEFVEWYDKKYGRPKWEEVD